MSFPPQTPAYQWYKLNQASVPDWPTMRAAIEAEFMPPFDAADKVAVLRSFKQEKGELVNSYHNYHARITLSYQRLTRNINSVFSGAAFRNEDATTKAYRQKVINKVLKLSLGFLFPGGPS